MNISMYLEQLNKKVIRMPSEEYQLVLKELHFYLLVPHCLQDHLAEALWRQIKRQLLNRGIYYTQLV